MAQPGALEVGAMVGGDYRVLELLRTGGMGAVYVVEQLSTGSRRALKIMHPSIAGDAPSRERFRREARVGSTIQSEHVVQVLGAGFDDRFGMPWLVMELLEGRDLGEELEARARLPQGEVLTIYEQLCHAVGAAHRAGIVHRDLKPENVFLAKSLRADSRLSVKVLDFGIAKVVAEAQARNTGAIGTPLYMAPEQTTPGEEITPRTDVWALGLIAFRLLTGMHFWKTARSDEPSSLMMLREVAVDPIPPVRERARELGVDDYLPTGFDEFFERSVTRASDQRYPDAASLLDGLREALGALPPPTVRVNTTDSGSIERSRAKDGTPQAISYDEPEGDTGIPQRSRSAPLVVAGLLGLAFLGGGIALLTSHSSDKREDRPSSPSVQCPRDMAAISGGSYRMGDVARSATVKGFCIDLDEVSQAEFMACVKEGTCSSEGLSCGGEQPRGPDAGARHPMGCVSYEQAEGFCRARGRRLPTEEEWEWVARRGKAATAYPWGNDAPVGQLCWSGQLERKRSCTVGSYEAGDTPEHVRDLAGNVSEWTSTRQGDHKRVIRGSSWADDDPRAARAAYRSIVGPTHRHEQLGFRCARSSTTSGE